MIRITKNNQFGHISIGEVFIYNNYYIKKIKWSKYQCSDCLMCYFYDNKCKNDFEICDHGPTLIDPR